jgi:hypothetical protein
MTNGSSFYANKVAGATINASLVNGDAIVWSIGVIKNGFGGEILLPGVHYSNFLNIDAYNVPSDNYYINLNTYNPYRTETAWDVTKLANC